MKYSIMGFSQEAIIKINKQGFKIDTTDLLILRWFVDFSQTDKMAKVMHNGNVYYWINYQALLDDLPILNIGKRMLSVRLQKMVDAKILTSYLNKNGGTFTMFGFGENYEHLISNMKNISSDDNKFTGGVTINLQPKNQSTKENKNNNIIINPTSENHQHLSCERYEDEVFPNQLKLAEHDNFSNTNIRDTDRYAYVEDNNIYTKADFPQNGKNGKVRLTSQILQEIIENWNNLGIGKVRDIRANTKRHKRIKGIIDDYGYDDFIAVMNTINDSPFLKGENSRNWKITMDWFLEPNNYQKVRDGNYINNNGYSKSNPEQNNSAIDMFSSK